MTGHVFETAYIVGLVLGSVVRVTYTVPCKRNVIAKNLKEPLDTVFVGLTGIGMALPIVYLPTTWLDFADYVLPAWVGWLGVASFVAAIVLLWRSHADLGRNWSPTPQIRDEHTLVTHGVYRRVRHPMYTAHVFWALAQALLIQNWVAGPAMLILFAPMCLVRIPREEEMMIEHFGDAYRTYMTQTGRLFPRLGR